jgi:hypothetical protein
LGIRRISLGQTNSDLVEVIIKVFDDMEGINTDGGLFKIYGADVFIRFVHVNTDIFDVFQLLFGDNGKITVKLALSSGRKDIDDGVFREIIKDAGKLGIIGRVSGVDFIDAYGFRKGDPGDVTMIIKYPYDSRFGNAGLFSYLLESHAGSLKQIHDLKDRCIGDRVISGREVLGIRERTITVSAPEALDFQGYLRFFKRGNWNFNMSCIEAL